MDRLSLKAGLGTCLLSLLAAPALAQDGAAGVRLQLGSGEASAATTKSERGVRVTRGAPAAEAEEVLAGAPNVAEPCQRVVRIVHEYRPRLKRLRTQGFYTGYGKKSRRYTQGFYSGYQPDYGR
ncbi:hypothetical protein SAMN06297382_0342 [Amphiplicatus metriothermophilus]|uniref:Uncharacterized protein n=2 Tax=Amphiplicatus metriothermophilus TaxID=1519374 RepID=A0A239PKL3_9PROT|nr:hypothetical protein SAMN06297382_0342 [Amphiplicatus metriothermophilus]